MGDKIGNKGESKNATIAFGIGMISKWHIYEIPFFFKKNRSIFKKNT